MDFRLADGIFKIGERLDQSSDPSKLFDAIDGYLKKSGFAIATIDWSQLTQCNSVGLLKFARRMKDISYRLNYRACPYWLIVQFTFLPALMHNASIESFEIPIFCLETSEVEMRLLPTETIFQLIEDLQANTRTDSLEVNIDGHTYLLDEEPDVLIAFFKRFHHSSTGPA